MTIYYVTFEADAPIDSEWLYIKYEYEVQADDVDQAVEQAKELHGDKPYHSTSVKH